MRLIRTLQRINNSPRCLKQWTPETEAELLRESFFLRLLVVLAPLAVLGLGAWRHWPWLVEEHRRLNTIEISLMWMSESLAFLSYLCHSAKYLLNSSRTGLLVPRKQKWDKRVLVFYCVLFLGIACDIFMSAKGMYDESVALKRAVLTEAQLMSAEVHDSSLTHYTLHCQYIDGDGVMHNASFYESSTTVSLRVANAASLQQFPVELELL